jgi:cation diffusion facilitator family transporter
MVTALARIFIKDYGNTQDPEVRKAYGMLCGAVGILLNILLFAGKALAGFFSGSIAIVADAFNNLSDAGSSVITLVGFRMAGQKPDSHHPFGHGRIEYISGFLVSIVILIMAFELLKTSVEKIMHPAAVEAGPLVLAVLAASILVKVYMALYNRAVGKKIDSAAMSATAKDSLSDTVATFVVLITTLLAEFAEIQIDGYCGVLVALFVFFAGFSAAKETIGPLLGQPPEPEFVKRIEEIIMEYKDQGVMGMHDLVVHNYGPGRVMLSVHVEVPAAGDILVLHDMIDTIEHNLAKELRCSAVIHMDPVCSDDALTNEIKGQVAAIIKNMEGRITFHDFRIVHGPTHTNLIFDVVVPYDYGMTDEEVADYIRKQVTQINENYFVVIEVDKAYA